ncbi:hypothetical protein [Streptomyces sp. TS71-3]|uniref:hypothetical protein n=1 Tax=Streptomyces sp. TS71-3 TaxID=2733862 RepID=UPI001B2D9D2C|nr:hypothetical protein [Streptomyces sp. TS71-3]GHJ39472.1 hypothetical protein Sm713_50810 [Streptomyces sp. TS71-3]
MGTKGSYTGNGTPASKQLQHNITQWLDALTGSDPGTPAPQLSPDQLAPALGLFRTSGGHADGPGGGAGGATESGGGRAGGGAQRTVVQSSRTAGRAAAAAYAYRTGNEQALQELGLDYAELQAVADDPIDWTRRIVEAACGPLADGTIEDEERRFVASEVAQWVLEAGTDSAPPTPEEVVRETLALTISEAILSEAASKMNDGSRPTWATADGERQIRETARALVERTPLTITGPSTTEITRAVEEGIEAMRSIWMEP